MAWALSTNNNSCRQIISDKDSNSDADKDSTYDDDIIFVKDLSSDDDRPISQPKNFSYKNGLFHLVEGNGSYSKQNISDEDSSSDDGNYVQPQDLGCYSYSNGSCNISNCANNYLISGVFCPHVNLEAFASNKSNLTNQFEIYAHSLSPPSNVRVSKPLNTAPANAHSIRSNSVIAQPLSSANGSTIHKASQQPVSSSPQIVLVENNLSNGEQMKHNQKSIETCSSKEVITRANNVQCESLSQTKGNKLMNLPSNSTSGCGPTSGPLYNWQATMTTVKERFAFLFNNEILSDVHFRVGKGESSQRIPAHRFVLAVGSAVFDAMFFGKLCCLQEEIELPDVEPQAFLSLLRFLYSDEVQIGPEIVMTVLYTAKKYGVSALERHCVEYLKNNLTPDNAFMLLTQARLFDEPQLAALCLDTIDKDTSDALLADGFPDIDHSTLCMVLERDALRIREAKLFQAVVRWSETKCIEDGIAVSGENHRQLLGEALSLIRFPLMTIEEFAQGPAQSNILTDKEIVQLFLYFTVNPKPSVNFLDIPRCCMTGKEQTVCRFQQTEARWGYSGTSDRIRFIVDRRIFVVGFGIYGSIHGPSEYELTIQLIHTGTGKVCASNDTSFISDGAMNTYRVMFKEPFEVLPNTNYTAYATLKGPDSHYGTKGVRKVSVECPSGDRVTFQFTYAAGNNNGTSVEDGQIPEIIFYT